MTRADYLNWKSQKAQPSSRAEAWDPQARPNLWGPIDPWEGRGGRGVSLKGGRAWDVQGIVFSSCPFPPSQPRNRELPASYSAGEEAQPRKGQSQCSCLTSGGQG